MAGTIERAGWANPEFTAKNLLITKFSYILTLHQLEPPLAEREFGIVDRAKLK